MKTITLAAALLSTIALTPAGAQPASQPLKVVLVDVEGGAATLYVTPDGKSLLVDTGWPAGMGGPRPREAAGGASAAAPASATPAPATPAPSSADRIVAAAHKLGLRKIDYLLITHYHVDHVGGLSELLGKIHVGLIMDHGPNREAFVPTAQRPNPPDAAPQVAYPKYLALAEQHNHRVIKAGDTLQIGAMTLHFVTSDAQVLSKPLWPNLPPTPNCNTVQPMAQDGGEENARSVGFVATYGGARVVALGDASWNQELKLVCPINLIGSADLFIVTQHGSNLSNSPPLIADVAPRVALMGNGSRKGGDKIVFETLADTPSKPVVWQVHQALKDADANRPPNYIANLDGPVDQGFSLEASVYPDGKITVVNSRNNFTETYTK